MQESTHVFLYDISIQKIKYIYIYIKMFPIMYVFQELMSKIVIKFNNNTIILISLLIMDYLVNNDYNN